MQHRQRLPMLIVTLLMLSSMFAIGGPLTIPVAQAAGSITGNVFRDFNGNGVDDGIDESGVDGVTVTAYDASGAIVATATTNATGDYSLALTAVPDGTPLRLEFTTLPAGYESGPAGTGAAAAQSSVRFMTATAGSISNVNFGILEPCDYCQANPNLATTRVTGDDFAGYASTAAILSFNSSSVNRAAQPFVPGTGAGANQFGHVAPMPTLATMATQATVGNLYGLAWHKPSRTLFSAAFGRANNMPNGGLGAGGLGAIYRTVGGVTSVFFTVPNVGTFGTADGNLVGTVGLGDLEISEDGSTLYVVNVFEKSLVSIPVLGNPPTAGTSVTTPLPQPANCPAANTHPFALGRDDDKLYIGMTCDGIGAADLNGYVYEYDGTTFSEKLNFPFNYARPNTNANYYGYTGYPNYINNNQNFIDWNTYPVVNAIDVAGAFLYADTAKSQPWLVDIEFQNGDMILGVRGRLGDARIGSSWVTGGDLLRACADSTPNPTAWTLESNSVCGTRTTAPIPATDPYTGRSLTGAFSSVINGIGGSAYYWGNIGFESRPSQGALAQIPGSSRIFSTHIDTISHDNEQGVMAMSHDTGTVASAGNVFYSDIPGGTTIGKGNALGDLELLCDEAPIEIGNRVWGDVDGDGVQDPDEAGLDGVAVQLWADTNGDSTVDAQIGTSTTATGGQYYFGGASNRNLTAGQVISATTAFEVRIGTSQAVLFGAPLSPANADASANGDARDSDASLSGANAVVAFTTGVVGANNHTYDIGFVALAPQRACITGSNDLGGAIFQDFNADGMHGPTEPGYNRSLGPIIATAYDVDNHVVMSTTTTITGTYNFPNIFATHTAIRLEFSDIPAPFEPSAHGTTPGSATTVQRHLAGTCAADLAINVPVDYCQNNPNLCANMYINGGLNATAPTNTLYRFPYTTTSSTTPAPTALATKAEIGATWGLAYNRSAETIYSAAFVKRHVGLGPNGPGAIYATDPVASTSSLFVDMTALGVNVGSVLSNAARGLGVPTAASTDPSTFDQVGKVGLGDIDISDDGSTLYVINLFDQTLYAVNIPAGTLAGSFPVPDPGCVGGNWRPFATKYYRNDLYVGGVCDAETSQAANDLRAIVYRFDGATFTSVFNIPLNYPKGYTYSQQASASLLCETSTGWYPWSATPPASCAGTANYSYPTPILSDLEFDIDGSLILGFLDRTAHQIGWQNGSLVDVNAGWRSYVGGDILRAYNNAGTFVLENNASAGPNTTAGAGNGDGPGGGEYYYQDHSPAFAGRDAHTETTDGGLALRPGSGEVVVTAMDPFGGAFRTGGVNWFNNTTGLARNPGYRLYFTVADGVDRDTFGKAAGMGDVELLCDLAPLEIGNYVWRDNDGDGRQDPAETPIPGVTVTLHNSAGTLVATTTTAANGEYYFNNANVPGGLLPNTDYSVRINTSQAPLTGLTPTLLDYNGNAANGDQHDSDGDTTINAGFVTAPVTTGAAGQNDHTYDFGFSPPPSDWGDLPDTGPGTGVGNYNTLNSDNGPRHSLVAGLHLGATVDNDGEGQPSAAANADDTNGTPDDEDGITVADLSLTAGAPLLVHATATNTGATAATLYGFIDFNGDGDFADAGEARSLPVPAGSNNAAFALDFGLAPMTSAASTYARFRLSTVAGLTAVGPASDGEVEDYPVTIAPAEVCTPASDDLGGNVFHDFNANGTDDGANELPYIGPDVITVTAYDDNNVAIATTNVRPDGTYLFPDLFATVSAVRLEFSGLPAWLQPSGHGSTPGSAVSVQRHRAGTCGADFAVNVPAEYCQNNPDICVPVMINNDPGQGTPNVALLRYPYAYRGTAPTVTNLAQKSQIGSTWGVAYNRQNGSLYAAAFLKRHVGLGPDGLGAIYEIPNADTTPGAPTLLINVATVAGVDVGTIGTNTARGLTGDPALPNSDPTAFPLVGKIGLGDIDISDDANTLYAVNLNQGTLLSIPIAAPSTLTVHAIPTTFCADPSDTRPFATKYYRGKVYVGVTCDGTSTGNRADLDAVIYAFDPIASTFTDVLHIPLDYQKGQSAPLCPVGSPIPTQWNVWTDTVTPGVGPQVTCIVGVLSYPQPLLTDVEFDIDGSMVIGFADRWGHQVGHLNFFPNGTGGETGVTGGDILRAYNNNGTFELEANGTAGPLTSAGVGNNEGPGGGEFYTGDYQVVDGITPHHEIGNGGLALLPGSGEVASTALDAGGIAFTGGVRYFNNSDGSGTSATSVQIYSGAGFFGKSHGLGDLEILCDEAPLEIGNYVWRDTDNDGIQDPSEAPIPGVTVTLHTSAGTLVATTTTDANGEYYFNDANVPGGLLPNTDYSVRINTSQAPLTGSTPTLLDYNGNAANGDQHDSDGDTTINAGFVTALVTTGAPGQNDHTYDFGFVPPPPPGAIGNYVWVDEDSDGFQDPGEPGIPNVRIILTDGAGNPVAEMRTDSHGGYLFPLLPPGDYLVDVDETTLPTGMTQTPLNLPNSDLGNQDHSGSGYPVTIGPGEENLTADFGYNYNPTPDVNVPGGSPTAMLGDRIWIDSDGDGAQDPNEIGVAGVEVTLYTPGPDGLFGTPDDVAQATDTTDINGTYLFDNLPPGAYVVVVTDSGTASHDVLDPAAYDQTGDPDHFGQPEASATPGTANDNRSTVPVVLGPGDVFLNVDFGYQPLAATPLGSIGDTIWLDVDADGNGPSLPPIDGGAAVTQGAGGTADPTEYGIPGVTVALIQDSNGDGIYQPATDPIIATTTTNALGQYLFSDLPLDDGDGDADYLVWVNDTANVLHELRPTYDDDGLATPNRSVAAISAGTPDLRDQDFGYTPLGQTPLLGAIGDTVWFDQDGSGGDQTTQGSEPGIEGVLVELLDTSGAVIATTATDENGHYFFGGLPLATSYQVRIAASNFTPGSVLEGLFNTFDPNAPFDSTGPLITLTPALSINLAQDFSYVGSVDGTQLVGRIGNLVWLDLDADGLYEAANGETPLGGVTVDLYRDLDGDGALDPGEPLIASTTTAATINAGSFGADGTYVFDGLPAGDYLVDVSDRAGVLAGYWHSHGTAGTNNNSQADPYAVTIAQGAENLTADFGYYVLPAAVGNFVWLDSDGDGIQDAGEAGINGVPVNLTITYPDGTVTTFSTLTGLDPVAGTPGWYSFGNLLLDEDYNGDGTAPEPTFTIAVGTVAGLAPTLVNQGSDDTLDSDAHAGVAAQPIQGQIDTLRSNDLAPIASYDFGFVEAGAIGNYVWVDEDSDGHQDAGESGIPNVRIILTDGAGTPVAETRTDAHGGYLFPNLPPGDYLVDVDETTLPPGMSQTPLTLPGADLGNQNHSGTGYPVTIGPGEENLTADFGYNYNPTPDVDIPPPSALASLGDRVWIDSDGDGAQDPSEPGVDGAIVSLFTPGPDGRFGTPDDVLLSTATTDANGTYLFDSLPAGAYRACVTNSSGASHDVLATATYTQTGDPDHFGQPSSSALPGRAHDNCTTVPVVLAPGDVFLNADFGYQIRPPAQLGSIGDTIWLDVDGDTHGPSLPPIDGGAPVTQGASGTADLSEYGIAKVTVALIRDSDQDGIYDPATDPIIATTTTNAQGQYLFTGLPLDDGDGDADYLVWVNDTASVLRTLRPSYDVDGLATPNISVAVLSAATPNRRDQDFGYRRLKTLPPPVLGVIGDTIWLDQDNSAGNQTTQGNEPGIEGVRVELLDGGGAVLVTTTTDENGHYSFADLPLNTPYQVRIAASNFAPGGVLEGMHNTFDSDGGNDSLGPQVTLTLAAPIDLDQDFSYVGSGPAGTLPVGRIGNLIWRDLDADGLYEPVEGETPIGGVTVDLYRDLNGDGDLDPDEPLLASTITAAAVNAGQFGSSGTYIFPGLPAGDYLVDVSDRDGVLTGYWHSHGTAGTDNHSQADPYAVTIAQGAENLTADFGYYVLPAAVGNYVWFDTNADGLQNDGQTGLTNVRVTLTITYPNGDTTTLTTLTSTDPVDGTPGWYSFGNLLLDEDYNGDGSGAEPTFRITVGTVSGLAPTISNVGSDDLIDSDSQAGVAAEPVEGRLDTDRANDSDPIASYDFGFVQAGAIGNYVWIDDDSDGEQDPGERGLSNIRILLKDALGTVLAQTRTNVAGGYLFPNLPPGNYRVDVDTTTLPPGMFQTPYHFPTADYGNQDHSGLGYAVTIGGSQPLVNLTADFGYNFNPTPDVTDPPVGGHAPAALGDRVWIDGNGDGALDDSEIGVGGVQLTLYHDPDGNGVYDTPFTVGGYNPVRTTTMIGYYLFDGLPPGGYRVCVTGSASATHNVLNGSQYTQTGDPDHFGLPSGTADDNCTTMPVVLAPGDVFLNADFGYRPLPSTPLGSIGDTVWFDRDVDGNGPALAPLGLAGAPVTQGAGGVADPSEYGLVGIQIALIRDSNGDGLWDADGADNLNWTADDEPVIATTSTDGNGQYVFADLSLNDGDGDADYIVWVQDTNSLLAGLAPTYDADGLATPNLSVRAISPAAPNARNQDFGYAPVGLDPTLGMIGDTVWFDVNGSGGDQSSKGAEAGIQGVQLELLDGAGTVIATTETNALGTYAFINLPLNQSYQVRVAAVNFTAGQVLEGFYNTYDPNAGNDSLGPVITLTPAAPLNLVQDFSYVGSGATGTANVGRIGNLVWFDPDADGTYEGGITSLAQTLAAAIAPAAPAPETPFANVVMLLYRDLNGDGLLNPGEPLLQTTRTVGTVTPGTFGVDGTYIFNGLPEGDYLVQIVDVYGVLNGYAKSHGTQVGQDNNSQPTPYGLHLDQGGENLTADFGFFLPDGAIGNWVWLDSNGDGIQNDGETGLNGVRLTLTATYPDGSVTVLHTTTGPDPVSGTAGWYTFGNLLLDEGFEDASARPTFVVAVTTPTGYARTVVNQGGNDERDSDAHGGVTALAQLGQLNTLRSNDGDPIASYDFGFYQPASLGDRVWIDSDRDGVQDAGERGVANVTVTLFTPGADGLVGTADDVQVARTTTNASGTYLFDSLAPGSYFVRFTLPAGYSFTVADLGGNDAADSDANTSTGRTIITVLASGEHDPTWDAGVVTIDPTAITLVSFTATRDGGAIVVRWVTSAEVNTFGFNLYRSVDGDRAHAEQVTPELILGSGRGQGAAYEWRDTSADAGQTYRYWLEEVEVDGATHEYGPAETTLAPSAAQTQIFLPITIH